MGHVSVTQVHINVTVASDLIMGLMSTGSAPSTTEVKQYFRTHGSLVKAARQAHVAILVKAAAITKAHRSNRGGAGETNLTTIITHGGSMRDV